MFERLLEDRRRVVLVAVALLLVLLVSQAGTDRLAPSGSAASTGRTIGRAGFAYVTGLRTFAAAVLWNRLEPQFHGYYEGTMNKQTWLMPTLRTVTALDPQFVQAYYVAPYVLAARGKVAGAVEVAEEGVRNNPRSAILRVSEAQIVLLFKKDPKRAAEVAKQAFSCEFTSAEDAFEGYRIMMSIFKRAGMPAEYARAEREYDRVKDSPEAQGFDLDHDHDGDGKPDH